MPVNNRQILSIMPPSPPPYLPASETSRFAAVALLTAIGAGLGGMALALLLHLVQHLAYGYSLDRIVGSQSFLDGVTAASAVRRVVVFCICGAVAGLGWALLYRFGQPLVSIKKAVGENGPAMPVTSTLVHALLQIVTVALGSPLGREVAPREIGSLVGGLLARHAGLSPSDCRLIVACGAGAGLAAVYNVPLAGALFVLEVLLVTVDQKAVITAIVTSTVAAAVAWIGLGNVPQYVVPPFIVNGPFIAWAAVMGPLFGIAARAFVMATSRARTQAPRGRRLVLLCATNFAVIGMLVTLYPALAGNGKGAATLSFDANVSIALAAVLLTLKVLIEVSTLRAGAEGGLLTPGLTNGALIAIIAGAITSRFCPALSLTACALVGAGAFLAASMQMPITATVLLFEFTHVSHDLFVPLLLAVTGSMLGYRVAPAAAKVFRVFGSDIEKKSVGS